MHWPTQSPGVVAANVKATSFAAFDACENDSKAHSPQGGELRRIRRRPSKRPS
jgi:hypothetical protein